MLQNAPAPQAREIHSPNWARPSHCGGFTVGAQPLEKNELMRRVILVSARDDGLSARLSEESYFVDRCDDVDAARGQLRTYGLVPVVLCAAKAHDLRVLRALPVPPPIIAIVQSSEAAVEALRAGALYTLRAPTSPEEVVLHLERLLEGRSTAPATSSKPVVMEAPPVLVGETMQMRSIKERIRMLAQSPTRAFLIEGESGTGKDTVARVIHSTAAPSQPFIYANFWERNAEALEAELFGVEADASNGEPRAGLLELADGGTLYLDEIALIPSALQPRLLRFLREGTFRRVGGTLERSARVRIISSTGCDLRACVRNRTLQAELVRRLSVSAIELPPLRDRLSDLPLLVQHFISVLSSRLGRTIDGVTSSTLQLFAGHRWPGNLRELANTLEREAVKSEGPLLHVETLPRHFGPAARVNYQLPDRGIVFSEFEREVLVQALAHAQGNQSRAAALLRISRDQLRYRMLKFGLRLRHSSPSAAPELVPVLDISGGE
jgi:two-component system response regulator AtoC